MGVNLYEPHVFVLPEDDANRQLADGFHLEVDRFRQRQMKVLRVAGGWRKVLKRFNDNEVQGMDNWPDRFMVLLIDFDNKPGRLKTAKAAIPHRLSGRVFVLGTMSKPEALKSTLGPFLQAIGSNLAKECREETETIWKHNMLQHNASELARLAEQVRPILF